MPVPVVDIRSVGMDVGHRFMAMPVRMGVPRRVIGSMLVLVVLVMDMSMLVFERSMVMGVSMLRAHESEHAGAKYQPSDDLPGAEAVSENRHGNESSHERCHGEECRLACRSDETHRVDGEYEAEPVAHEAKQQCEHETGAAGGNGHPERQGQ